MATSTLYPVILAGGSGTRLWPLSRKNYPKQFLCLQGELSLLQQTFERITPLPHQEILLIGNEAHYFIAEEQLATITHQPLTYLLEPCPRNTAPAAAIAALELLTRNPDAIMLIMPADHWIGDAQQFCNHLNQAAQIANETRRIVTLGIKPDKPHTGYGYIEAGNALRPGFYHAAQFHEKPSFDLAATYIQSTHYYWNSGIFIMRADTYIEALQQHAPDILNAVRHVFSQAHRHQEFIRFKEDLFSACRNESIDYAVMEKVTNALVMPLDLPWSDLGCWSSVAQANAQDSAGNTILGSVITQDTQNCLISSHDVLVTTLGVQDHIVIATPDAILVANKQYSQDIKSLVERIALEHTQLTEEHRRVSRPWGFYEILAEGSLFKVKRLMVKPGAKLSLQIHRHRAEHWVVVGGVANIVNGETRCTLSENQSTYIPQNTKHRLSNTGDMPLYVIEVQTGDYLGEDDIERFDDVYERHLLTNFKPNLSFKRLCEAKPKQSSDLID